MPADTNGTPEALDERNPCSLMSQSHGEGSQTLEKGPGPQRWGRRHGEAFKFNSTLLESVTYTWTIPRSMYTSVCETTRGDLPRSLQNANSGTVARKRFAKCTKVGRTLCSVARS
jgi:hypothetical protein